MVGSGMSREGYINPRDLVIGVLAGVVGDYGKNPQLRRNSFSGEWLEDMITADVDEYPIVKEARIFPDSRRSVVKSALIEFMSLSTSLRRDNTGAFFFVDDPMDYYDRLIRPELTTEQAEGIDGLAAAIKYGKITRPVR